MKKTKFQIGGYEAGIRDTEQKAVASITEAASKALLSFDGNL